MVRRVKTPQNNSVPFENVPCVVLTIPKLLDEVRALVPVPPFGCAYQFGFRPRVKDCFLMERGSEMIMNRDDDHES